MLTFGQISPEKVCQNTKVMVLVIDNYDSFTYNLVQYLGEEGMAVDVRRNDEISLAEVKDHPAAGILLSPGPCTPAESGVCLEILTDALTHGTSRPIFGVCLGHQAMGLVVGATVRRARTVMHGKASRITHDGQGLFAGVPDSASVIRYHSLTIEETTLPPDWIVSARSQDDHEVMGIRHATLPLEGVQFHPESVLSEGGHTVVQNFVARVTATGVRS